MISIVIPYRQDLLEMMKEFDGDDYEVVVAGSPHKNMKHLNARFFKEDDMASSLVRCMRECRGSHIAVITNRIAGARRCVERMKRQCDLGADIVIGKREKKSRAAKMFVSLMFPGARALDDPLSDIFLFKSDVIKNAPLHPIGAKLLLEILLKGKYGHIAEVPVKIKEENNFNESYSAYSLHLLRVAWEGGEILRFAKFGLVGILSVLLNEVMLWLLLENGMYLALASVLSIESSILCAFLLNEMWTFRDRGEKGLHALLKRATKFNVASLAGLLLNFFILLFLHHIFGMEPLRANICGIAAAFIWNFLAHNLWTWRE